MVELLPLPAGASSTIDATGYDSGSQTLAVRFKSGDVYHYFDVPHELAQGLVDADSAGKFLHANIKNAFNFEKIAIDDPNQDG